MAASSSGKYQRELAIALVSALLATIIVLGAALVAFYFWTHSKSMAHHHPHHATQPSVRYFGSKYLQAKHNTRLHIDGIDDNTNDDDMELAYNNPSFYDEFIGQNPQQHAVDDDETNATNTAANNNNNNNNNRSVNYSLNHAAMFTTTDFTDSRERGIDVLDDDEGGGGGGAGGGGTSPLDSLESKHHHHASSVYTKAFNTNETASAATLPMANSKMVPANLKSILKLRNELKQQQSATDLHAVVQQQQQQHYRSDMDVTFQSMSQQSDDNENDNDSTYKAPALQHPQHPQQQQQQHRTQLDDELDKLSSELIESSRDEFDQIINKRFASFNMDASMDDELNSSGYHNNNNNNNSNSNNANNIDFNCTLNEIEENLPELFADYKQTKPIVPPPPPLPTPAPIIHQLQQQQQQQQQQQSPPPLPPNRPSRVAAPLGFQSASRLEHADSNASSFQHMLNIGSPAPATPAAATADDNRDSTLTKTTTTTAPKMMMKLNKSMSSSSSSGSNESSSDGTLSVHDEDLNGGDNRLRIDDDDEDDDDNENEDDGDDFKTIDTAAVKNLRLDASRFMLNATDNRPVTLKSFLLNANQEPFKLGGAAGSAQQQVAGLVLPGDDPVLQLSMSKKSYLSKEKYKHEKLFLFILLPGDFNEPRRCDLLIDPNYAGLGIHLCDTKNHMIKDIETNSPGTTFIIYSHIFVEYSFFSMFFVVVIFSRTSWPQAGRQNTEHQRDECRRELVRSGHRQAQRGAEPPHRLHRPIRHERHRVQHVQDNGSQHPLQAWQQSQR